MVPGVSTHSSTVLLFSHYIQERRGALEGDLSSVLRSHRLPSKQSNVNSNALLSQAPREYSLLGLDLACIVVKDGCHRQKRRRRWLSPVLLEMSPKTPILQCSTGILQWELMEP